MINWNCTKAESDVIFSLADRAVRDLRKQDRLAWVMDFTACHANGCPLDLARLLAAPDADFGHDALGIRRHIDRQTGKLTGCFLPRCAATVTV